jgi:hypothetical protein
MLEEGPGYQKVMRGEAEIEGNSRLVRCEKRFAGQ